MPKLTTNDSAAHQLAVLQYEAAARAAKNVELLVLVFVWIPLALALVGGAIWAGVALAGLLGA